jgi:hypothetical protein
MRLLEEVRARSGLLVVTLLAVTMGLGLLAMFYWNQRRNQAKLAAVLAETDALEPDGWKLEDLLRRRPVVPDSENAALVVLAAKKHRLKKWPSWEEPALRLYEDSQFSSDFDLMEGFEKNPPNVLLPSYQFNVLRNEVCRGHRYIEAVRKVAGMPRGCLPPPALSSPIWSMPLPDLNELRLSAKPIAYSAWVRIQEGDLDLAVEDVIALLNIAHCLDSEVFLASHRIRDYFIWKARQLTERILGHGTVSEESLLRLQRAFADFDSPGFLVTALRGDRAFCHRVLEELLSGQITYSQLLKDYSARSELQFLIGPFMDWSFIGRSKGVEACIASIRNCNQLIEVVKDEERLRGEYETVRQKYDRWRKQTSSGNTRPSLEESFQRPQYHLVLDYLRTSAQLRTIKTALAAERYRLRHGAWPEKVADLVPEFLEAVPTDPFDGQPLRWRTTPEGRVVYSVGFDKEDNGGQQIGEGWLNFKTRQDLATRLYHIEHRRQPSPKDSEPSLAPEPPPGY